MGTFEVRRTVRVEPERVFAVVGDLRNHGDFIPLTTIEGDDGAIGVGWRFTARSGFGPLALVDRMEVTEWSPAESFVILKRGPVLDGWARVELRPHPDGTAMLWRERIVLRPRPVGQVLGPVLDIGNRALFAGAVDRMVRRAERS